MKLHSLSATLLLSIFASAAFAQAPATAPAGTTGMCKDGSFSNAASKAGACSGHKGIKTWYVAEPTKADKKAEEKAEKKADEKSEKKAEVKAEAKAEAKADKNALEKKGDVKEDKKAEPMKAAVPAAAATKAAAPAAMPAAAPATTKAAPAPAATPAAASATAKAAPAANSVWVNTETKVYHCPGTRYYGKTKNGSYMTEAEATAKGGRPDHGKACGK